MTCATEEFVQERIDALVTRVDEVLAETRAATVTMIEELGAADTSRLAAAEARGLAREAEGRARHDAEESARLAFFRVTRLADVASRLIASGRYKGPSWRAESEGAVSDAADIIALCEAREAKP